MVAKPALHLGCSAELVSADNPRLSLRARFGRGNPV
jgi:hypothetical protein